MLREPDYVIGKKVITSDAFILGDVVDIRCETAKWHVTGLKIKTASGMSSMLNLGRGKSMALLQVGKFTNNDVIITDTINKIRNKISTDNSSLQSVLSMEGMKVLASDATLIGTVDCMEIDFDKWTIGSIKIKLDKNAYAPLGIKKGLFSKKASGIKTSNVKSVGESIVLSLDTKGVAKHLVIL